MGDLLFLVCKNSVHPSINQALCPQSYGGHALFTAQWRQQVLFTQKCKWKVDQQTSDGLQLLFSLLRVCVTETFFGGMLLQLSHVVDSLTGQGVEDLDQDHSKDQP